MAIFGNSVTNPRVYIGMSSVLEKYDWLKDDDALNVLSEAEFNARADQTIKDFTRDAENYLLDVKTSKDKKQSLAQGFALASLGLYIVGAFTLVVPVVGILMLVASIVTTIISIVNSVGVANDIKKLKDLKLQAIRVRGKVKDRRDADQLQFIIDMIDHEVDGFYRDQPNRNVNYNYNFYLNAIWVYCPYSFTLATNH